MKFQKTVDQDKILKAAKEKQIIKQLISKAEELVWQQTFCWQHFQLATLTPVSVPEDIAVMSSNLGEIVFNLEFQIQLKLSKRKTNTFSDISRLRKFTSHAPFLKKLFEYILK